MPKYSLTKNNNVIECKWNCNINHKHFVGTYENAIKYFDIDQSEIKSYGDLMNIIIYHQTSQYTTPKLSNELYDILIRSMAEHKYWVEPKLRHEKALELLEKSNKINLIIDKKICKRLEDIGTFKTKNRLYAYNLWCKQNDYYI